MFFFIFIFIIMLISLYGRAGEWERALEIMDQMKHAGFVPDQVRAL
jgi:pentatricopeptide repeat protein